ncbi:hypothetical protein Tco_0375865 [Tanacetum coccineum]
MERCINTLNVAAYDGLPWDFHGLFLTWHSKIYTTYSNPLDTAYRSSDTATEIIAKMKLSGIDDDLFTYEAEILGLASISYDMEEEDDLEFTLKQFFLLTKDCYKKQLNEYMEIKKQWVTYGIDADIEYDPSNVEFAKWLASKFYNHKKMDQYTKNALWIYRTRGDDKTFNEFNYLFQINPDVLTKDIVGFKTYEEYKDDRYMNGMKTCQCPTCIWKDNGYCNGGNLLRAFRVGNTLRYQDLDWYEALKDGKLKDEALKNKAIMEKLINEDEESYDGAWRRWDDYENTTYNNDEEREPNDDHGIGNLDKGLG